MHGAGVLNVLLSLGGRCAAGGRGNGDWSCMPGVDVGVVRVVMHIVPGRIVLCAVMHIVSGRIVLHAVGSVRRCLTITVGAVCGVGVVCGVWCVVCGVCACHGIAPSTLWT